MTDVGTYLLGYVTGYWEGFDFAETRPKIEELEQKGSAIGGADAPPPAPGTEPTTSRFAPARPPEGTRPGVGSDPSAVESLPAIRQVALPGDVEVAGELEKVFIHRGMVTALSDMATLLARLGMTDAARLCLAATDIERDGVES